MSVFKPKCGRKNEEDFITITIRVGVREIVFSDFNLEVV